MVPILHTLTCTSLLALNPLERWQAARRFESASGDRRWFIVLAAGALIILVLLLLLVSVRRMAQGRNRADRLFLSHARKRGLSGREHRILQEVAKKAGLRRPSAVFTMSDAFELGAAKMIEQDRAQRPAEENEEFRSELSFLREKLGFTRRPAATAGSSAKSKTASSRQIPVGRKVGMTRRKNRGGSEIESAVIENDGVGLTVKTETPIKVTLGEYWRVRYHFGTSIWEFDTTVISCEGQILVLNHSDHVRFINRRRFLRAGVNVPGLVACFPFTGSCDNSLGPPEFLPVVVTELAGPGLRLDAPLELKTGDRLLVVLQLNEYQGAQAMGARAGNGQGGTKIIQDIGEVRRSETAENGFSIAVELTGLGDADLNELIRVTNLASLQAKAKRENIADAAQAERSAVELASAPGV